MHEPSHASEQKGSKGAHRDDIACKLHWFELLSRSVQTSEESVSLAAAV